LARHNTSWNTASSTHLQSVQSSLKGAVHAQNVSANHSLHTGTQTNSPTSSHWNSQANAIRNHVNSGNCFHNHWWTGRHVIGWGFGGWYGGFGYQPWLGYQPWWYWWGTPSWNSCVAWFPSYGWNQGCYYNYGQGGNVLYQDGQVVMNGQDVGTAADFAQSAAELAAVDPAALKATPEDEWLPLGTFSMAVSENEVDPARVMQLAVNKEGLVSGTIHNRSSGNTYTVQGRVDKETQRVAFTIGNDSDTVLETGIYNLTQDQTPVLCHFGKTATQTYLLARLPEPKHEEPKDN
jgi:hypothetical protein